MTSSLRRVEILTRSERRRRWTDEEKLEIVRQTLAPGSSVSIVARQHDVAPSQLFAWRKQALAGAMAGFIPVEVTAAAPMIESSAPPSSSLMSGAMSNGTIEVDMPNGCRVRVGSDVDGAALARVLTAIAGMPS